MSSSGVKGKHAYYPITKDLGFLSSKFHPIVQLAAYTGVIWSSWYHPGRTGTWRNDMKNVDALAIAIALRNLCLLPASMKLWQADFIVCK